MTKLYTLAIFAFFHAHSFAQNFELALTANAGFYTGEIEVTTANALKQSSFIAGIFGRYNFENGLTLRGQVYRGSLYANEKLYANTVKSQQRGLSFRTPLTEIGLQAEYNFLKLDKGFNTDKNNPFLSVYGFSGICVTFFNPKIDNAAAKSLDNKTSDIDRRGMSIPIGLGTKLRLNDALYLGIEGGLRRTFSDNLDGFSQNATKAKDYYFLTGVYISWSFGQNNNRYGGNWWSSTNRNNSPGCPTFRNK